MELLVIRHGIAEERGRSPDEARELTPRGRRRTRQAARGLSRLVGSPDLLATSPLARAVQTAEIVARALRPRALAALETLVPEADPADLAAWLRKQDGLVVVVGHEPHLGRLVAWLLGAPEGAVPLRKAGAVLLDVLRPESGGARLLWAAPPRLLRSVR